MRRKVLQDFANTVCQNYLDLTCSADAAFFACYGSGTVTLDIFKGRCSLDGFDVVPLPSTVPIRDWLQKRLAAHNIAVESIVLAEMILRVVVLDFRFDMLPSIHTISFECDCHCEIRTDEKAYIASKSGFCRWGIFKSHYENVRRAKELSGYCR
jgi:hypothetical protein